MPYAPPTVCCWSGCHAKTNKRFCSDHEVQHKRETNRRLDAQRGSANQRGYNARWQRASKQFLRRPENALCACGCGHPSTVVDHREPHHGNQQLFWDETNWQGMTKSCHDAKTAREDGGFGHAPAAAPAKG